MSISLRKALEDLRSDLGRLSASMDAVVFCDMWRAIAAAITRLMFNEVATEAHFTTEVRKNLNPTVIRA